MVNATTHAPHQPPPYAIVLSGAISKLGDRGDNPFTSCFEDGGGNSPFDENGTASALYDHKREYVPLHVSAASIRKHVMMHNGGDSMWDIFAHSWNPELEHQIRKLFKPSRAVFEDNRQVERTQRHLYSKDSEWSQVSWSISRAAATSIMLDHAKKRGADYSRVVYLRPDVLFVRDMRLHSLPPIPDAVYAGHETGDLHFVLQPSSSVCVRTMAELPAIVRSIKTPVTREDRMIRGTSAGFWIPKALERAGCRILVDTHLAQWSGLEVLRKLVSGPIPCAGLERLREDYGLTPRDWEGLRPKCCDYREDACYAQAEATHFVQGAIDRNGSAGIPPHSCPCGCTAAAKARGPKFGTCDLQDGPEWLGGRHLPELTPEEIDCEEIIERAEADQTANANVGWGS